MLAIFNTKIDNGEKKKREEVREAHINTLTV